MRFLTSLLLTLILCFATGNLFGQVALGFTPFGISTNKDSLFYSTQGDSIVTFQMWVQNKGSAPFDGTIFIKFDYQYGTIAQTKAFKNVIDFHPGDSTYFEITDTITRAPYKGGDNLIVIWPPTDNMAVLIADSGSKVIWVDSIPVGIQEPRKVLNRVVYYPNPVKEVLNFRYLKDKNKFEYVRIMNILGQDKYNTVVPVKQIDLSGLPKGVYFLEIKYKDGLKGTFRLIHID